MKHKKKKQHPAEVREWLKLHADPLKNFFPIGDVRLFKRWPHDELNLSDIEAIHELTEGRYRYRERSALIHEIDLACLRNVVYVTRLNTKIFPPSHWQHQSALNSAHTWERIREEAIATWPGWKLVLVLFILHSCFENFC